VAQDAPKALTYRPPIFEVVHHTDDSGRKCLRCGKQLTRAGEQSQRPNVPVVAMVDGVTGILTTWLSDSAPTCPRTRYGRQK